MRAKLGPGAKEVEAEFDLAFEGSSVHITVHARGGSVASGDQTNPGYEILIQTLLERLKFAGASLEDVLLASKTVAGLARSQRRIPLQEFSLPIELATIPNETAVRLAIRRGVVTSHSKSKVATHGNATKRIELIATCPLPASDVASLLEWGDIGFTSEELLPEADAAGVYVEGAFVLRTHFRRERNRGLVYKAKARFKGAHGRLFCEACGFNFADAYGDLGEDFIEAHHESPLGDRDGPSETRIEDLRMVCSNCHRMLHRRLVGKAISMQALRDLLGANRTTKIARSAG